MKLKERVSASVIGILFMLFMSPFVVKAQYEDVSMETFYEELSPYGVWIEDPQYGRVWRPDVDQDEFRPYYTNGHWEMTKYGNTWVSDYDWGWAPFHYGRWHHSSRRGWVWVPDVHWGPAWVSWRSGGGYYGWAPLGPGINININIGRIPDLWWVFVPQRHIYYDRYPRYDYRRNRTIYHNTVIINNTFVYNRNKYYTGPRADDIRRVTRQSVKIHEVRNSRPTYAGRSSRPESGNGSNVVQSPRPQRSAVSTDSRNTGSRDGSVRSSGTVNPSAGRSTSATDQRASRASATGRDSSPAVDRGSSTPNDRSSSTSTARSSRPSTTGVQPSTRTAPSQSQRVERTEPSRSPSSSGQSRSSQSPQRVERSTPPQRTSPSTGSQSPQRSERTQQARPAPSASPRSSSPQRTETRQAPSSSRQSAERSSAPSGRSADRSSSNGRPSRGN